MLINLKIFFLLFLCFSVFGLDEGEEAVSTEPTNSAESKEVESKESNEFEIPDSEETKVIPQKNSFCVYRNVGNDTSPVASATIEYPWMVGIFTRTDDDDGLNAPKIHVCGGALINPSVVVTNAHCVQRFKDSIHNTEVRIGFKDSIESNTIQKWILLDHFEPNYHINAIAVLILNGAFKLKENVQTVCLPPVTANFDGNNCLLLHYKPTYDNVYKEFNMRVTPTMDCSLKLQQMDRLDDSVICATGPMIEELCQKMLGSPLICPIKGYENQYYLAGVASFPFEEVCPTDANINLFVNVALFTRWIERYLKKENIENTHFTV